MIRYVFYMAAVGIPLEELQRWLIYGEDHVGIKELALRAFDQYIPLGGRYDQKKIENIDLTGLVLQRVLPPYRLLTDTERLIRSGDPRITRNVPLVGELVYYHFFKNNPTKRNYAGKAELDKLFDDVNLEDFDGINDWTFMDETIDFDFFDDI